jgi:hypothetical protein
VLRTLSMNVCCWDRQVVHALRVPGLNIKVSG